MTRKKQFPVKPAKVPARIRLRKDGYRSKRSDAELRAASLPKFARNYQ